MFEYISSNSNLSALGTLYFAYFFHLISLGYAAHLKRDPDSYIYILFLNICIFMNAFFGKVAIPAVFVKSKRIKTFELRIKHEQQ